MKIERKDNKEVALVLLDIGDCFEYREYLYVLINDSEVAPDNSTDWTMATALCLNDNKLRRLSLHTMVRKRDAKVVVK